MQREKWPRRLLTPFENSRIAAARSRICPCLYLPKPSTLLENRSSAKTKCLRHCALGCDFLECSNYSRYQQESRCNNVCLYILSRHVVALSSFPNIDAAGRNTHDNPKTNLVVYLFVGLLFLVGLFFGAETGDLLGMTAGTPNTTTGRQQPLDTVMEKEVTLPKQVPFISLIANKNAVLALVMG